MLGVLLLAGALLVPGTPPGEVLADDHFAPVGATVPKAVTHDVHGVPPGSHVWLAERAGERDTWLTLRVHGLRPDHTYGIHVHTEPCGRQPKDSGPHYQDQVDPRQPSVDPAYANPRNEVWLDLTTDRHGAGEATAHQRWRFRPGQARSVVLHQHGTSTERGHAGTAGDRLACVSVPLR
ncbi:superoxide dismutase [Wenjunlia vitaminophila]|uniref:Superoxide dismutase n=1 Tax=Wenjunlia vitaminophila TaxID=76728 RepID=A0A0T6LKR6_WENVI|nr:superoxide dismutase family protein [Wenjunlia vitaminophila]KRV46548.1 superoxide dismutase [Wenjunlia vitaminophila]